MTTIEQVEAALATAQLSGYSAKETIDGAIMLRREDADAASPGDDGTWAKTQAAIEHAGLAVERQADAAGTYLRVWSHEGTGADPV